MALTETNGIVEEATEEEMMDAAARADLTGMGRSPFRVYWSTVWKIWTSLSRFESIAEEICMSGQRMVIGMECIVDNWIYCDVCWGCCKQQSATAAVQCLYAVIVC